MPVEMIATTKAMPNSGTKFRFMNQLAKLTMNVLSVTIELFLAPYHLAPLCPDLGLDFRQHASGNRLRCVIKTFVDQSNKRLSGLRFQEAGILIELLVRYGLVGEQ